jgi:hypothetical protein
VALRPSRATEYLSYMDSLCDSSARPQQAKFFKIPGNYELPRLTYMKNFYFVDVHVGKRLRLTRAR